MDVDDDDYMNAAAAHAAFVMPDSTNKSPYLGKTTTYRDA